MQNADDYAKPIHQLCLLLLVHCLLISQQDFTTKEKGWLLNLQMLGCYYSKVQSDCFKIWGVLKSEGKNVDYWLPFGYHLKKIIIAFGCIYWH